MDDGGKGDEHGKKSIDHENRNARNYAPKPELTKEARRIRSERMKAFHRKTGKGTALGNAQALRKRKPK